MTCKYCGEKIADGAKFCENCGNKVEPETVSFEETASSYKEPERVEADVVDNGAPKMDFDNESSIGKGDAERVSDAGNAGAKNTGDGPIGYSIASLVCGILGLLCCCCGFFGLVLSAAGIALGIVSLNKNCEGRGMAIAGIACGGVGAAFIIIGGIISLVSGNFGLNSVDPSTITDQVEDFLDSL